MKQLKAIVIGLDGADFDMVEELMKNGEMPFLASLASTGSMRPLVSTIPPITPVAWNSIYTGTNPGKHGVFDFTVRHRGPLITSTNRRARPFWRFLNEVGLRTVLVNMPMCFPPESVDGVMVSGFGGPERPGVAPAHLGVELDRVAPDYATFVHPAKYRHWEDPVGFVEELKRLATRQIDATRHFVRTLEPDLAMLVLPSSDTVCHVAYHVHDPNHPAHPAVEPTHSPIVDVYRHIDSELERLVQDVAGRQDETTVFVISDHGSKPIYHYFWVNRWLQQLGYLGFRRKQLRNLRGIRRLPRVVRTPALGLASRLDRWSRPGWRRRVTDLLPGAIFGPSPTARTIDRSMTTVLGRGTYGQLWLRGTLRDGGRERILTQLKDDVDRVQVDGMQAFEMKTREELYQGQAASSGPDAYLVSRVPTLVPSNRLDVHEDDPLVQRLETLDPQRDYGASGWHGMEGIWIAAGPTVTTRLNPGPSVDVVDVAPTLLRLFGLPTAEAMDGSPIQDLEAAASPAHGEPHDAELGEVDESVPGGLTAEEEASIVEMLEGLGYL